MKKLTIAAIILMTLSGCAAQKHWGSSGGSKADGIVKLSYVYGAFEIPEVDNAQGQRKAVAVCQAWGYQDAQAFDFTSQKCQKYDPNIGCAQTLVTKEYQCL